MEEDNASKKEDKKSMSSFNQPTVTDKEVDVLDPNASNVPEIDLANIKDKEDKPKSQSSNKPKSRSSNKAINNPESQPASGGEKNASIKSTPMNISDSNNDPRRGCSENQPQGLGQILGESGRKSQTSPNDKNAMDTNRCLSATNQVNQNKI